MRTYQAMDHMVGKLMTKMDGNTILVVMSDHGGTPHKHGRPETEEVLEQAGLLVYRRADPAGQRAIGGSRTKADSLANCNTFTNLEGRDPERIVKQETMRGYSGKSSPRSPSSEILPPGSTPSLWR